MSTVVERIEAFNQKRDQTLLNRKYEQMSKTPFAFFRATCHLFFEDWPRKSDLNNAPTAWIAGDLHPQNFAVYQGDDTQIYLDINDFDDGLLAPCTWDITRLLTSLHVSLPPKTKAETRRQVAQECLNAYVAALSSGKARNMQPATAPLTLREWMGKCAKSKPKQLFDQYVTGKKSPKLCITDESFNLLDDQKERATKLLSKWIKSHSDKGYRQVDVVGRVAGISSIGLERYLFLVAAEDEPTGYALFEVKQRIDSALAPYVPTKQPDWANAAARVVALQHRLQAIPPAPSSMEVVTNRSTSYTMRQLQPVQEKMPIGRSKRLPTLRDRAQALGSITAWAHLRGCRYQGADSVEALMDFASPSDWQTTALEYATDYAERVQEDFATFCKSDLVKTTNKS